MNTFCYIIIILMFFLSKKLHFQTILGWSGEMEMILTQRIVVILLNLIFCSFSFGTDYYLSKNFVIQTLETNAIIATEIFTGQTSTNLFKTKIYHIEASLFHDYLSLQQKCQDDEWEKEYIVYDIRNKKIYTSPYLRNLEFYEKRWSINGQYTFFREGYTSFGIIETDKFFYCLKNNLPIPYKIEIEGDPCGQTSQEEGGWLHERYLIFGTGQGEIIAWGLLDIETHNVYFLDVVGDFGTKPLTVENRSIKRLQNEMYKLLSAPPHLRMQDTKYFRKIVPQELNTHTKQKSFISFGTDYYLSKNFVIQTLGTNAIIAIEISTGLTTTNNFNATICHIESSSSHDYLSLRLKNDKIDWDKEFFIYDIRKKLIYDSPYYHILEPDEKRWSINGRYTYLRGFNFFKIVQTKNFIHGLEHNLPLKADIMIVSDPYYEFIFQEEGGWQNERFLIFGAAQGDLMVWGLLDLETHEVYFLTTSRDEFISENCTNRIEYLQVKMYKLLSTPPHLRLQDTKYFRKISFQEVETPNKHGLFIVGLLFFIVPLFIILWIIKKKKWK